MPETPGQKMFRCFNGTVEVATFICKSVLPGATAPTLELRDSTGRVFRCSPNMYQETERKALIVYREEIDKNRPLAVKAIAEAHAHLERLDAMSSRIRTAISAAEGTA